MSRMISTAENFQYSVNIAYDLNNAEKIKAFIPTKSSLELLESILLSTQKTSSKRARILIGAYGKGKSHIVLTILSILMHHLPESDFVHLNKILLQNPRLNQIVRNYFESGKKLLPVLITGSGNSLSQSFLLALKNTLSENNLSDIMPETNYRAAVNAIQKWKTDYPETLKSFEKLADSSAQTFISRLKDFDQEAYLEFEKIYPSLTAGSLFNPFLGFDVVELYESVAKELRRKKLYDGLYVVYDEFSKYLEANIESATVSDTKMLQDFAEKSCRSGENQLHLLLISHKEIGNYIDKLPKQKTDGWRGISERFEHVLLNNNFTQVYEIISTVIQKEKKQWNKFVSKHEEDFKMLEEDYKKHELFKELKSQDGILNLIMATYPLHPVSTFILPRLSERIAQNERTLFTFLSSDTGATLPSFLKNYDDSTFTLVTPDLIFDYFEPILKKEIYYGEVHEIFRLTSIVLEKIRDVDSVEEILERKIIKSISLIYILAQFERLKPSVEEIARIYCHSYARDQIENAIKNLIEKESVVYLRQSNSYLKLKETSGVDIGKSVHDEIERQKKSFILCDVLNENNDEPYFYPYRYNDQKEMVRFFDFSFVDFETLPGVLKSDSKSEPQSDGKILAVTIKSKNEENELLKISKGKKRFIFAVLKKNKKIEDAARKLNALTELCKRSSGDEILLSEYKIVLDDIRQIVLSYIKNYTHPENNACRYFYNGIEKNIKRRSTLSMLLSEICEKVFADSPVINNEAINKNEITQMAYNSRRKILAGLLRTPLEKNLGLTGSGQDVAIMRSTLLHVGLLVQNDNRNFDDVQINFDIHDDKWHLRPMLNEIWNFVKTCDGEKKSFAGLYKNLTSSEYGIGMRKGLIPIYMAAVFGRIKNQIVLYHVEQQVQINADNLALLNDSPAEYSLLHFTLDEEKEAYIRLLQHIFSATTENTEDVFEAVRNWYLSLPKYSMESKTTCPQFIKVIKEGFGAQELLFDKLPHAVGMIFCNKNCAEKISQIKNVYDRLLVDLKEELSVKLKNLFGKDLDTWCSDIQPKKFDQLYEDGTEKFLSLLKNNHPADESFMAKLALMATGLRLEDWDDETKIKFLERVGQWKKSAESIDEKCEKSAGKSYSVTFPDGNGNAVTRHFEKLSSSPRSKLLFNKITDALDVMGKSMSESEKRQVLMDVLLKMCGGEE